MSLIRRIFGSSDKSDDKLDDKKLDIEKLLASDDENGSIIEIDSFICELCAYGDELDKLTEQQRNFYFNQNLEREINNGGFSQYFFNSAGNFAHETTSSLETIGAYKTAEILRCAIAKFPNKTALKDRTERQLLLEKVEESSEILWEELDEQFYGYEDDLNALNLEYVRQNKSLF